MPQSYSGSVPEVLRESNADVRDYLGLLDAIYDYKKSLLSKASRFYNPVLLTDPKFLVNYINELGFPDVPVTFPKIILDNLYLCGEDLSALMGSKRGLNWLMRCLTCGLPTINDSRFYPTENYIILSDLDNGYLPGDADYADYPELLYLFSGVGDFVGGSMTIDIATPFWDNVVITSYIRNNIRRFVGFTDDFNTITINFTDGPFVRNPYMYEYFSRILN